MNGSVKGLLEAYSFAELQRLDQLITHLVGERLSVAEIHTNVKERLNALSVERRGKYRRRHKNEEEEEAAGHEATMKCKLCGSPLMFLPLNESPATVVEGGYTHMTLCKNHKCLNEVYYK